MGREFMNLNGIEDIDDDVRDGEEKVHGNRTEVSWQSNGRPGEGLLVGKRFDMKVREEKV